MLVWPMYTLVVGWLVLMVASSGAQDKKDHVSELSAAVEKAGAEQTRGTTVRGFSLDKENGQPNYEAEMTGQRPPQGH
jgi:hypothetical protein